VTTVEESVFYDKPKSKTTHYKQK